jgi:hypothetical protein
MGHNIGEMGHNIVEIQRFCGICSKTFETDSSWLHNKTYDNVAAQLMSLLKDETPRTGILNFTHMIISFSRFI